MPVKGSLQPGLLGHFPDRRGSPRQPNNGAGITMLTKLLLTALLCRIASGGLIASNNCSIGRGAAFASFASENPDGLHFQHPPTPPPERQRQ